MRYVTVATVDELPTGERGVFEVEGLFVLVFNVDGRYYAVEDRCTHEDLPLEDGELDGYELTCPYHGARFDIRTGKVLAMPAVQDVRWFPTRVEGGAVQIGLAADA